MATPKSKKRTSRSSAARAAAYRKPQPATTSKPSNQTPWAFWIVIVLLIVAIGVVGFMFWRGNTPQGIAAAALPTAAPTAVPPTKAPPPTAVAPTSVPANTSVPPTAVPPVVIPPTAAPALPTAAPTTQNPSGAPYNLPPQTQIGHPSLYLETGVPDNFSKSVDDHTKIWTVPVIAGTTAIIGGFKVDGVSNGVYKAIQGPTTLTTTVTDGFIAITKNEWAEAEFNFRVGEAVQYCWAHEHVTPLAGWKVDTSGGLVPQCATLTTTGNRQATGQNNTLRFEKGAEVWGWKIVLDSGKNCDGGDCYLASAPAAGSVLSGVINPWPNEVPTSVKAKTDWSK